MEDALARPDPIDPPGEVEARLGLSAPTIWRMRRRGEFPEPIRLSPNRVGWRRSTIDRWLEEREAAAQER